MTSIQNREQTKTQKTLEDETPVSQKNKCKMQTYMNLFEENNGHTRTMVKYNFVAPFRISLLNVNKPHKRRI